MSARAKIGGAIVLAGALHACSSASQPSDNGGFQITLSGEDLAGTGYDFAANALANGDPPAFVDGWEVRFDHVLVTVDKLRIAEDPDRDPSNPSFVGDVVASADGPWAVDATIGGPIPGKSGSADERAVELVTFPRLANGDRFDPTKRYAFSYDIVAASASAKPVNLDAAGLALYEQAKARGWAMVYAGTATFKGGTPPAGSVFSTLPSQVSFTLGFANPSSFLNCANTDLAQLPNGEFPRGIQASAGKVTTAQITIHTDHAFWSKLNVEGTELHFDAVAARARRGGPDAIGSTVTLDDLVGADVTGFRTSADERLGRRSLVPDYSAPEGTLAFDANGATFASVNSYASFMAYAAASGGHLNADGQCVVRNNFTP